MVDHKAGEIIRFPLRIWALNRFSTGAEWSILVLGSAKYSKRSSETQVGDTLKKHHREFISRSIQNGWALQMVATGCAIAVNHPFNLFCCSIGPLLRGKCLFL